jgi:hypothetical protein
MSELHVALGHALDGKTPYEDADYVEKGPYPFVCGSCDHFSPEDGGMCDIVEGPYDDGGVEPDDSCRFWTPRSPEQEAPEEEPEEPDDYEEE